MRDMNGAGQGEKQGMSCLVKGLIGCAGFAFVSVIGGIIIGYYVLFHTAVPATAIAAMLNQDPDIQIEGITGSISSGFGVETMRFTDDNGNVNALDDVRLKYEKDDDVIVITEVHVGRGYFYVDRSTGETTYKSEGGQTTTVESTPESDKEKLKVLVKKVSINDITVEDVSTGEKFKLEGIQLENLSIGDDFSMGELVVKCTGLDLTITPSGGAETGNSFTVNGVVKPALHKNLIAPIDLKGSIDASVKDEETYDLAAFGGKLTIKGTEDKGTFTMSGLTLADYFKEAPPLTDINFVVSHQEKVHNAKGSFLIGTRKFEVDQVLNDSKDKKAASPDAETADNALPPKVPASEALIAKHVSGTTTFELSIDTGTKNKLFPDMTLATKPAMSHDDALATLMAGKKSAGLSPEERKQVDQAKAFIKAVPTK